MEYLKKDGENQIDYIFRLTKGKDDKIYDIDYSELFKLGFNVELSSNESRKRFYTLRMLLPYIDVEKLKNTTGQELLNELTLQKQELQKEKIKIQTEKLGLNQMLREEARYELFIEHALNAIDQIREFEIPERIIDNSPISQSGVLFVADPHYSKELTIKGLHGEILNQYSVEIFEQRMWRLLDKTVLICEKENFKNITVMNLGDELEGILRISALMTLKYGLVDSTINYAYFMAGWLNELSKYVTIDYYATAGNHTDVRLLTGKKGDFPNENLSKIIHTLIKQILINNPNVKVHENEIDKIFINIQGYNLLGLHGEEKNIQQAIRDYSFMYNEDISYLASGHKHHANSVNLGLLKGSIGVGSIIGIDDYSMSLKRMSDPSATFAVFEKGKGKTIEYNIPLN
jgi:hypothetical protein